MVLVSNCGFDSSRFDSYYLPYKEIYNSVWLECTPDKRKVVGSSPIRSIS